MADAIKFRCKSCEKKIAVRTEYAGKRVKCPGCKQPVRVPSPRPKRSSTGVPVAVGAASSDPSPGGASSISLADLAEMEENAHAELKELSPKAASRPQGRRIEGGKDCPGCGSSVKPEAVICVHCGNNFESGKKLKTKKDSKVGKAFSSVKDSASNVEVSWTGLLLSFRYIIGGIGLCALGIMMAFFGMRPDSESSSSTKTEAMSKFLAFFFDTLGGTVCGGILLFLGLCCIGYGLRFVKR